MTRRFSVPVKNGAEFGCAGKAGKMLRIALRPVLINSADGRMASRLTRKMVKVIQADLVNELGLRNVIDGEGELLLGFEFNIRGKLGTSLFTPFTSQIDRATGDIKVNVPSFIPASMFVAPSGTTHYKIISTGAEVDFEAETFVVDTSATAILPWNANVTVAIVQTNNVTAASTKRSACR